MHNMATYMQANIYVKKNGAKQINMYNSVLLYISASKYVQRN
jgi:hypothetical protein